MSRLLPDDLARSIFRKGANFTAAMAFEMASTNLVLELSIIMLVLLGWQITLAEFIGAPIMVALQAKEQAEKGVAGRMEGHAEMGLAFDCWLLGSLFKT